MRRVALIGISLAVVLGLASRVLPIGLSLWDKSLGDLVYAAMVGFVLLALRPTLPPSILGFATFGICAGIELFQLTDIPARQSRAVRFLLGSTFAWHDLACYALGTIVVVMTTRLARLSSPLP